jgi:hypothetical protein
MSYRPDLGAATRGGPIPDPVKAEINRASWLDLAAILVVLAGAMNVIDGISALDGSKYVSHDVLFSNLTTWGWVQLAVGIVQILAGSAVYRALRWGAAVAIVTAFFNAIEQVTSARTYPLWSLMIFALDILVIYGLVARAGIRKKAA